MSQLLLTQDTSNQGQQRHQTQFQQHLSQSQRSWIACLSYPSDTICNTFCARVALPAGLYILEEVLIGMYRRARHGSTLWPLTIKLKKTATHLVNRFLPKLESMYLVLRWLTLLAAISRSSPPYRHGKDAEDNTLTLSSKHRGSTAARQAAFHALSYLG